MIGRALRAQARSFAGDVVLRWVAIAAVAMSLSLVTSVPAEYAEAPVGVREALSAPFSAVLATYGAVLAAVYGSFRYTVDRRDGVVAQRLMLQPRWTTLLARVPATATGGAVVALAGVIGGRLALAAVMGGIPLDLQAVASTMAIGALAGLWGLGVGIVVQAHLVAVFVVSASMGSAILVAMLWNDGAVYLPLLAMLEAFRFDVSAVGIMPPERIDSVVAALVAVGWVAVALAAGCVCFMKRDVT